MRKLTNTNQLDLKSKSFASFNKSKANFEFQIGEKVLLRNRIVTDASNGVTSSLIKKFAEPYLVVGKICPVIYKLKCL